VCRAGSFIGANSLSFGQQVVDWFSGQRAAHQIPEWREFLALLGFPLHFRFRHVVVFGLALGLPVGSDQRDDVCWRGSIGLCSSPFTDRGFDVFDFEVDQVLDPILNLRLARRWVIVCRPEVAQQFRDERAHVPPMRQPLVRLRGRGYRRASVWVRREGA
jgi:hypothetical protein